MTSSMFLKCFHIAILTVMPPRFLSARFIIPMWNEPPHKFKTSFTKVYLWALCGHLSTVPRSFSACIYRSDSDVDIWWKLIKIHKYLCKVNSAYSENFIELYFTSYRMLFNAIPTPGAFLDLNTCIAISAEIICSSIYYTCKDDSSNATVEPMSVSSTFFLELSSLEFPLATNRMCPVTGWT